MKNIERQGWCSTCKTWVSLQNGKSWLPDHINKKGKLCKDSGYSYWDLRYVIKTAKEARAVANWIAGDEGKCLDRGGNYHSLNCDDGKECEKTRLRWAKALANYVLRENK